MTTPSKLDLAEIFAHVSFHFAPEGVRVIRQETNLWRVMAPKDLKMVYTDDINVILEIPHGLGETLEAACNDFAQKIWDFCSEDGFTAFAFVWVTYLNSNNSSLPKDTSLYYPIKNAPFRLHGRTLERPYDWREWFVSMYPVPSTLRLPKPALSVKPNEAHDSKPGNRRIRDRHMSFVSYKQGEWWHFEADSDWYMAPSDRLGRLKNLPTGMGQTLEAAMTNFVWKLSRKGSLVIALFQPRIIRTSGQAGKPHHIRYQVSAGIRSDSSTIFSFINSSVHEPSARVLHYWLTAHEFVHQESKVRVKRKT